MGRLTAFLFLSAASAITAFAQSGSTPTVTAKPASVSFSYQMGSTIPAAQSVSVKTTSGTPSFTTSVSPSSATWVTRTPDSGNMPGNISIRVNPGNLGVGTYSANVVVTITGIVNPVNIPVTLTITAPLSTLTISSTTLNFTAPPIPASPQMVILSTNSGVIGFTATSGSPWLSVTPTTGTILAPGEQVMLTIAVDPTTLAPQTAPFTGKITIATTGTATKSQTITVNFTLNSSVPGITNVWPNILPLNSGDQTITVYGANFYSGTVAMIQGVSTPLKTTVYTPTQLWAVVPASLLIAPGTLNVYVSNPAPGGSSVGAVPITASNAPTILGIANVASYATGTVSPGELVTIFGGNLGPAIPAGLSVVNGVVSTSLSGVSVTVDGVNAPILYASQNQVNIQVPYEVTAGANKLVTLTNGSNSPVSATVTIANTAPGIFVDSSGVQAAALTCGATSGLCALNNATNMAKVGDTLVFYVTGEGEYATAALGLVSGTGYIIPANLSPLPQMNPLPTVMIGSVPATVSYAGPIPDAVLGLLQINAVVPSGTATGAAVPISVTIGGNQSQSNVTVAIHP